MKQKLKNVISRTKVRLNFLKITMADIIACSKGLSPILSGIGGITGKSWRPSSNNGKQATLKRPQPDLGAPQTLRQY